MPECHAPKAVKTLWNKKEVVVDEAYSKEMEKTFKMLNGQYFGIRHFGFPPQDM